MTLSKAIVGLAGAAVLTAAASPTAAQNGPIDPAWRVGPERPATIPDLLIHLERDDRLQSFEARGVAGEARLARLPGQPDRLRNERSVRFGSDAGGDTLRVRTEGRLTRADGAPLPVPLRQAAQIEPEGYDVTYIRDWTETLGTTETGLDVTLTPHVGLGVTDRGGVTEAGATLRVGRDLDRLVPDGGKAFGERTRWYLYAAGSGRAVGYNWARTRDGDFARSGVSHDSGAFLGDASVGMALRRGALHGSIGLVYREIEVEGIRGGQGIATDKSEGLVAFQLSIKPN